MKAARNSGICMKLDDFTGVLSLEHLDVNTMVYLYSEQGELIGKFTQQNLLLLLHYLKKVCMCL